MRRDPARRRDEVLDDDGIVGPGADVQLAKRMGLLHDIGKALTHEQEGSHPELSLQVLTKYNESPQVINAALCGHENVEAETIEATLIHSPSFVMYGIGIGVSLVFPPLGVAAYLVSAIARGLPTRTLHRLLWRRD